MNDPTSPTPDHAATAPALSSDDIDALETLLDDLRTRSEEIPQWEFCDGFLTALVCSRRAIGPSEYLPMLLGDGAAIDLAEGESLPLLEPFADAAQQAQFLALWQRRWNEVEQALDTDVKTLDDERTFEPDVMDMRGAVAALASRQQFGFSRDQSQPLA